MLWGYGLRYEDKRKGKVFRRGNILRVDLFRDLKRKR